MIAQRPSGAAPAVQARAEELPFRNGSFDAVLALQVRDELDLGYRLLTVHVHV
jgi:hypothetical protein